MSFALASFFAFMALVTAAAPVTHLGGWLIKVLLYTVFLGLTLLIGNSDMVRYAEAARVFSVLFLLSQVVIIVNLVYNLHEALVSRMMAQEERLARQGQHSGLLGNCWSNLYVLLCVGFVVTALTGCGLMYHFFGGNCPLNNFFISQTLVVGLTLCALSLVFPGTFGRGLLPPATIMAYNTYLTFSAITNNPDAQCNPSANAANQSQASIIAGLVIAVVSVTWTALSSAGSIHSAVTTEGGGAEVAAENPAAAARAQAAESYQGQGKGSRGAGSRGVEAGEEEEEEEKEARQRRAPGSAAGAAGAIGAGASGPSGAAGANGAGASGRSGEASPPQRRRASARRAAAAVGSRFASASRTVSVVSSPAGTKVWGSPACATCPHSPPKLRHTPRITSANSGSNALVE